MRLLPIALATALLVPALPQGAEAARVDPIAELDQLPDEEDEAELWDIASGHENNLRNEGRVFHDREVEAYLESIADRMLGSYLDHLGLEIDFILVKEPTLSGWVYPYGTIAVHTGLLAGMDNEAQLASILAHELSHFMQRHSYRELISEGRQSLIGKGLGLLATAAIASQTGVIDTGLIGSTGGLWTDLVTSGYSRKLEYVADEEGLDLMARAGYDRGEAVEAFRNLGDNALYGAADPMTIWSSHPKLDNRIENLEEELEDRRKERERGYPPGEVPDPEVYYEGIAPVLVINAKLDLGERQWERARAALRKYLTVRPDDPEAQFLIGDSYRMEAPDGPDFGPRIAAYQRALQIDSGYGPAHRELGMAYRQQHANAQALAAFEQYLSHAGEAPDAGIIRGYVDALEPPDRGAGRPAVGAGLSETEAGR